MDEIPPKRYEYKKMGRRPILPSLVLFFQINMDGYPISSQAIPFPLSFSSLTFSLAYSLSLYRWVHVDPPWDLWSISLHWFSQSWRIPSRGLNWAEWGAESVVILQKLIPPFYPYSIFFFLSISSASALAFSPLYSFTVYCWIIDFDFCSNQKQSTESLYI